MGKMFGTDGVRGVANQELTGEMAYKLGRAGGFFLTKKADCQEKPEVLVGKDTRISGDMLEAALIAGFNSVGIDVIQLGIIPTPGVAYLTSSLEVIGSVMISASHNPVADNGIKFFNGNGYKLSDEEELKIEKLFFDKFGEIPEPTHENVGQSRIEKNLKEKYVKHLLSSIKGDFSNFKVVLDCANGAAYQAAPEVISSLNVDLTVINAKPDGEKINVNCGSTYPGIVKERLQEKAADIGIAHDGDADRVILVDERGNIVDGDKIMAILALYYQDNSKLKNNTLVTTRYSNFGLKECLDNQNIEMVFAKNGDRYVLAEMLNNDYNLGGEKSGHIICLDYNSTGDGILTALQVLQVMEKTNKTLSELASVVTEWPQRMANIKVKHKNRLNENKVIAKAVEEAEKDLGDSGRIFIRASGTEPVVRLMLEGKNEDKLKYWENQLKEVISNQLN